jgi:tetratricopeptide (TPR) repeat protein
MPTHSTAVRLGALTLLATVSPLPAQEEWAAPAVPCAFDVQHRAVKDAIEEFQKALEEEKEERKGQRFEKGRQALVRALGEDRENPAAWYYLARYYHYYDDVGGADSAFAMAWALAPDCRKDIDTYRTQLQEPVVAAAVEAWLSGRLDSAAALFDLASSLLPNDANVPLHRATMYAEVRQFDSAETYLARGIEVAGDDPGYDQLLQRALLTVARERLLATADDPAAGRLPQSRWIVDSLQRAIKQDSLQLARLIAEWSGAHLRPEDRQRVQRDSSALADRLAKRRGTLRRANATTADDSAAASAAFEPVLEAYRSYLDRYPEDAENSIRLLRVYSLLGHVDAMDRLIGRIGRIQDAETEQLVQAGADILNDGHPRSAAKLLELALARNSHSHTALFVLAQAYYKLEAAERLRGVAGRLVTIDPLNPRSVRMMAAAWELAGNRDSTRKYVSLADSGLAWAVSVSRFASSAAVNSLSGTVANIVQRPLPTTSLVFEFLDPAGIVVAAASVDVPALQPGSRAPLTVQAEPGGAVAWRYRRP